RPGRIARIAVAAGAVAAVGAAEARAVVRIDVVLAARVRERDRVADVDRDRARAEAERRIRVAAAVVGAADRDVVVLCRSERRSHEQQQGRPERPKVQVHMRCLRLNKVPDALAAPGNCRASTGTRTCAGTCGMTQCDRRTLRRITASRCAWRVRNGATDAARTACPSYRD